MINDSHRTIGKVANIGVIDGCRRIRAEPLGSPCYVRQGTVVDVVRIEFNAVGNDYPLTGCHDGRSLQGKDKLAAWIGARHGETRVIVRTCNKRQDRCRSVRLEDRCTYGAHPRIAHAARDRVGQPVGDYHVPGVARACVLDIKREDCWSTDPHCDRDRTPLRHGHCRMRHGHAVRRGTGCSVAAQRVSAVAVSVPSAVREREARCHVPVRVQEHDRDRNLDLLIRRDYDTVIDILGHDLDQIRVAAAVNQRSRPAASRYDLGADKAQVRAGRRQVVHDPHVVQHRRDRRCRYSNDVRELFTDGSARLGRRLAQHSGGRCTH